MNYEVIIPAAGQGKRMGGKKNKLFLELNKIPVFIHTLHVFVTDAYCSNIWLVVNPQDKEEMFELVKAHNFHHKIHFVYGGAERQHSVYNAVKQISTSEMVLVHDAARPFISKEKIRELTKIAEKEGAAVLAVPIKDTVKKVQDNTVLETIDRSSLWAIQTPQAFRMSILREAHEKALMNQFLGTDDASLVEYLGGEVKIVTGNYNNIKLTTPEDMCFAEAIMNKWRKDSNIVK